MTGLEFLRAVWPAQGLYCLAAQRNDRIAHLWYKTVEAAAEGAHSLNERGATVYHACASFGDKSRKASAAAYARAFWLDLDVGTGKAAHGKFPSVQDAAVALKKFVADANLPRPSLIIGSGGGLHVYWTLDEDLPIEQWRPIANELKRLTQQHDFRVDQSRTADAASILRPVGTLNRKYTPPREVRALLIGAPASIDAFVTGLRSTLAAPAITAPTPPAADVNADFDIKKTYQPANADKVASLCAQMRALRDTKGNLPEPVWYAGLQVLAHCANGATLAHEWSKGHPAYSPEETSGKMRQAANFGPTLCSTFEARNPEGCEGCPHKGKVTTPVMLGAPVPGIPREPTEEGFSGLQEDDIPPDGPLMPLGFLRGAKGQVFYQKPAPDGEAPALPKVVSLFDFYANELAHDEQAGCEMMLIKANAPNTGPIEFALPTHLLAGDRDLEVALRRHHCKPGTITLVRIYLSRQVELLEKHRQQRRYYSTMGWKDNGRKFVWGDRLFNIDGSMESVSVSEPMKPLAAAMRPNGSLDTWVRATHILNSTGMEAHAFMFAGCAAAPLMRFTGHAGALLNAVGHTNSGKSSMARFGLSIFGDYERLKLKQRDTDNAKVQRIAQLGSLPAYIDEITNEDPLKLSDFVYEISQGRSKLRLKIDGQERSTHEWNTIALSSSNTPMAARLMLAKTNPEAERMRLLEFHVDTVGAFSPQIGEELFHMCSNNYGLVAERYLSYIVQNQERVRNELQMVHDQLRNRTKARGAERMWSAAASCSIYALMLLKRLGLSHIEVKPVLNFIVHTIEEQRMSVDQDRFDPVDNLGAYLNQFSFGRLTVHEEINQAGKVTRFAIERLPTRELVMRFDTSRRKLWVDAHHYRAWLSERHESWIAQKIFLTDLGLFTGEKKMNLGTGTSGSSAPVKVYEFDMNAPAMGEALVAVVTADGGFQQRVDSRKRDRMMPRAEWPADVEMFPGKK